MPPPHVSEDRTEEAIARASRGAWVGRCACLPEGKSSAKAGVPPVPRAGGSSARWGRTGDPADFPDFLLVERGSLEPHIVIQAKSDERDLPSAVHEAEYYADAFSDHNRLPLAVGVVEATKPKLRSRSRSDQTASGRRSSTETTRFSGYRHLKRPGACSLTSPFSVGPGGPCA